MSAVVNQPADAETPRPQETLRPGTLFRFATAGSVDDGKSTLVGRILHDSQAILADTLEAVSRTSAERGFGGESGGLDLALLTDGLRAEREQGITIDVAYRYFATDKRSFVLADCPGHVQYTRNTVTGASTADAVVLLIDARKGVLEQTRRHLAVLALLRVPHLVVAVNKIDLVGFSAEVFAGIARDVTTLTRELGLSDPDVIPVSALDGDNVVRASERTPWYTGAALLERLESLPTLSAEAEKTPQDFRFPVQSVIRPQGGLAPGLDAEDFRDYRGYAGQIVSGTVRVGQKVTLLPSKQGATVSAIDGPGGASLEAAQSPQSVVLRLAEDLDAARGEIIASGEVPEAVRNTEATVAWLAPRPLLPGAKVLLKHGTSVVKALVRTIDGRVDLSSFALAETSELELNDIGTVHLQLASALPLEPYAQHRKTGAFLLIDPVEGSTLAAGMVGELSWSRQEPTQEPDLGFSSADDLR